MVPKTANLMSGHLSDKQKAVNKRERLKAMRLALEYPLEIRERSQKRYKDTPKRARFEMAKRAYIVRKHGLAAYEMRVALMSAN